MVESQFMEVSVIFGAPIVDQMIRIGAVNAACLKLWCFDCLDVVSDGSDLFCIELVNPSNLNWGVPTFRIPLNHPLDVPSKTIHFGVPLF